MLIKQPVLFSAALFSAAFAMSGVASAQAAKPNILFIVADDVGWGDLGPYGGGVGRGMPTPNIDKLADGGMTFFDILCTAELHTRPRRPSDRTHSQPQRHDHRGLSRPRRRLARS